MGKIGFVYAGQGSQVVGMGQSFYDNYQIAKDVFDNIDLDIDVKKLGRQLLNQIESKDIRVRERCSEPFIMRGSYHMLADQFKIGWHADFKNRLKYLLKEEDSRDE